MNSIAWHMDWQVPKFPKQEGERRHRLIRNQMGYRSLDCLIIAGTSTSFRGHGLDCRYVAGHVTWFDPSYIVFPYAGQPMMFTFNPGAAMLTEAIGFVKARTYQKGTFERDQIGSIVTAIKELGMERARIGIVSMRVMSAKVYVGIREALPNAQLIQADDLVRQIREIKGPLELEFMRKSAQCADKGWEAMRDAARPGVRELEIASACDHAMQNCGAESGPHLLLSSGKWKYKSGANTLSGGARVLQRGDLIVNEITPSYGGYYTQLCRPITLGPPDDDFKCLYQIHLAMYEVGRKELKPGAYYDDIERKINEVAIKLGKDRLDAKSLWTLQSCEVGDAGTYRMRGEMKPGMCFVIHPYTVDAKIRDGSPDYVSGHIIGDSFIITENGNECLSKLPHEITVI